MATIVSYLRKGSKRGRARRGRLVAGAAVAAVFLPGTVLLTGCGPPPGDPKIIVVVASATANEPAPVLSGPDQAMLRNAGNTSTRAAAYVVDPNTGQAREVSLTPRRADGEVDYGPDRNRELAANVQPCAAVAEQPGGQPALRPAGHDRPGGPGDLPPRHAPRPVLGPVHGGQLTSSLRITVEMVRKTRHPRLRDPAPPLRGRAHPVPDQHAPPLHPQLRAPARQPRNHGPVGHDRPHDKAPRPDAHLSQLNCSSGFILIVQPSCPYFTKPQKVNSRNERLIGWPIGLLRYHVPTSGSALSSVQIHYKLKAFVCSRAFFI